MSGEKCKHGANTFCWVCGGKPRTDYVDARTPEQREKDTELQRTAVTTFSVPHSESGCCEKCVCKWTDCEACRENHTWNAALTAVLASLEKPSSETVCDCAVYQRHTVGEHHKFTDYKIR